MTSGHRHPANQARHDRPSFGDRVTVLVTRAYGSWRFIGAQALVIAVWMLVKGFGSDPWPFIALNLMLSAEAAFTGSILQKATNQQTEHDRLRAEADHDMLTLLKRVNEQQLAILQRQDEVLAAIHREVAKAA